MSTIINTFFNQNPKYLNDISGINFVENYEPLRGWADFTDLFCDSMLLWCIYEMDGKDIKVIIESFIYKIKGIFKPHFRNNQYRIKNTGDGVCGGTDGADEAVTDMIKEKDWNAGYIAINITFHDIDFDDLFLILEKIMPEFLVNCIIIKSIDITVDCGRITTRKIIKDYLFSRNLAKETDIAEKPHSVGNNCISYYHYSSIINNSQIRVKIYNKFVQILESCEVRKKLGSRLSHLIADSDTAFIDKVKRFRESGYSRIEITIYGNTLFNSQRYRSVMNKVINEDLSDCPTFKVPIEKQWHLVVDQLTQVTAVYVEDTSTFAYCHWWNSLTKRKQGSCWPNINGEMIETLLANFSFNDRPIHLFYIRLVGKSYDITNHEQYRRADGSTAMTFVPGTSNAKFPYRGRLEIKDIMFKDVGLDIYKNIYIEWPNFRIDRRKVKTVARLVRERDGVDSSSLLEAPPGNEAILINIERPQAFAFKADYSLLELNATYTVRKYGYSLYRGAERLYLVLDEDIMIRCSENVKCLMEPKVQENAPFQFKVIELVKRKTTGKITCQLL